MQISFGGFLISIPTSVVRTTYIHSLSFRIVKCMEYHYEEDGWIPSKYVCTTRNVYSTIINNIVGSMMQGHFKTLNLLFR